MFCFHPMIMAISIIAVMGKCFIDWSINAIKKCFKRNDSIFLKRFQVLRSKALFPWAAAVWDGLPIRAKSLWVLRIGGLRGLSSLSLWFFSIFTILHHWYIYASFVFSVFMTTEKSTALEEGGTALELTEQKINMMVLDICHKPGGSEYLRQIYHIMRLNEVGKRPFYRAIRCVLAWGSVCWQLRVSQGGDNTS